MKAALWNWKSSQSRDVIDVANLTGKDVKFGATVKLVDEDTDVEESITTAISRPTLNSARFPFLTHCARAYRQKCRRQC